MHREIYNLAMPLEKAIGPRGPQSVSDNFRATILITKYVSSSLPSKFLPVTMEARYKLTAPCLYSVHRLAP